MENKKFKRYGKAELLAVIVVITTVWMYWMNMKTGFCWDELTSYGVANSNYSLWFNTREGEVELHELVENYIFGDTVGEFVQNISNFVKQTMKDGYKSSDLYKIYRQYQTQDYQLAWKDKEDIYDYLTVNEGERFHIFSIYECNWEDVHPPLYHIMLNAVCSLFIGQMSKWFAFVVNVLALWGTCLCIYGIMKKIGMKHNGALFTVLVYGLGAGAASTAIYLRMYAMLTLMVVALVYQHICLRENGYNLKKRDSATLIIIIVLGYLTQYFFCVVAFALFLLTVVDMIRSKNSKKLRKYILHFGLAVLIGLCLWPFGIKHMFLRGRGTEAIENIGQTSRYLEQIRGYLMVTGQQVFGNAVLGIAIGILLIIAYVIYRKKNNSINIHLTNSHYYIIIPAIFYLFVISIISPEVSERYVTCIFPLITMWTIFIFSQVINKYKKAIAISGLIIYSICSFIAGPVFMRIIPLKEKVVLNSYRENACIFVDKGENSSYQMHLDELACYDKLLIVYNDSMEDLFTVELPENVVVYVSCLLEMEDVKQWFQINTDYTNLEILLTPEEEYGGAGILYLSKS